MSTIAADIEARLAGVEPDVELLLAEVAGGRVLRVFIDHPAGVTLDLCARVSHHLAPLRAEYALEVSSPGIERPLTKPDHFRRFLGRRVRVRTRDAIAPEPAANAQRSFTGELVAASEQEVTIAAASGVVSIPYAEIQRSNLVGD